MKFREFLNEKKAPKISYPKSAKIDGDFVQFKSNKDLWDWFNQLPLDAVIDKDIGDDTGEIFFEKQHKITRRKYLKSKAKDKMKKNEDYEEMLYGEDLEYSSTYRIVKKDMEKMVDDPEYYYDNDYDLSYTVPVAIKRKDGKEFSELDKENIESYINDYYNSKVLPNNLKLSVMINKNIAQTDIMFN